MNLASKIDLQDWEEWQDELEECAYAGIPVAKHSYKEFEERVGKKKERSRSNRENARGKGWMADENDGY